MECVFSETLLPSTALSYPSLLPTPHQASPQLSANIFVFSPLLSIPLLLSHNLGFIWSSFPFPLSSFLRVQFSFPSTLRFQFCFSPPFAFRRCALPLLLVLPLSSEGAVLWSLYLGPPQESMISISPVVSERQRSKGPTSFFLCPRKLHYVLSKRVAQIYQCFD